MYRWKATIVGYWKTDTLYIFADTKAAAFKEARTYAARGDKVTVVKCPDSIDLERIVTNRLTGA